IPSLLLAIPRNPITAIGIPVVFGMMSGSSTGKAVRGKWYKSLRFPPGRPPEVAFPFVWSTLYAGMGYASYIAVHNYDSLSSRSADRDRALISTGLWLYYGQLALNFSWSTLFFSKKKIGVALIDSITLTSMSIYMTKLFHNATDGATTWFLGPYCAWLLYATYLQTGTWWLNRGRNIAR
ncbi:TspO/MBR-like protein, partial [Abortiporus biennis]